MNRAIRCLARIFSGPARTQGTAAIEFALVVTALIFLLFGIIEFGRYIWTMEALQETATAGARCMAVTVGVTSASGQCASSASYSTASTTSFIQSHAAGLGLTASGLTIGLTSAATTSSCGASGMSQVTLKYTFKTVLPAYIPIPTTTLVGNACFPNN